ncbi:hypothetical protein A2U01_0069636, partial [Trifolium medium]|nr:hypothetical protein [Trifolium medium]
AKTDKSQQKSTYAQCPAQGAADLARRAGGRSHHRLKPGQGRAAQHPWAQGAAARN